MRWPQRSPTVLGVFSAKYRGLPWSVYLKNLIFNALCFTESVDSAACELVWDLRCKNLDTFDEMAESASFIVFWDFLLAEVFYVFAFEILLFLVMLVIAVFYDYEF